MYEKLNEQIIANNKSADTEEKKRILRSYLEREDEYYLREAVREDNHTEPVEGINESNEY